MWNDIAGFDNLNRNTIEHMGDSAPYAGKVTFYVNLY